MVHNFGGFTDGDRAVFLASALRARMIILAGMDLGSLVGQFSKVAAFSRDMKLKKLRICRDLLEWLASDSKIPLYNLTQRGENIKGVPTITLQQASKLLRRAGEISRARRVV
jgi:uncharacterized Rossmann fold enzyme